MHFEPDNRLNQGDMFVPEKRTLQDVRAMRLEYAVLAELVIWLALSKPVRRSMRAVTAILSMVSKRSIPLGVEGLVSPEVQLCLAFYTGRTDKTMHHWLCEREVQHTMANTNMLLWIHHPSTQ